MAPPLPRFRGRAIRGAGVLRGSRSERTSTKPSEEKRRVRPRGDARIRDRVVMAFGPTTRSAAPSPSVERAYHIASACQKAPLLEAPGVFNPAGYIEGEITLTVI